MENVLTVKTAVQAALFEHELKGQLSDGAWENAEPHDHWEVWCLAKVTVGENIGRNFYARRDSYAFSRQDMLLDIIGTRMLAIARLAFAGFSPEEMQALRWRVDDGQLTLPEYLSTEDRTKIEAIGLDRIATALADPTYTMKMLKADLYQIQKTIKVRT